MNKEKVRCDYKRCSKCKTMRNFAQFHKNSKSKDGLVSQCKFCRSYCAHNYYQRIQEEIERKLVPQEIACICVPREFYIKDKIWIRVSLPARGLKKCNLCNSTQRMPIPFSEIF